MMIHLLDDPARSLQPARALLAPPQLAAEIARDGPEDN
jgi:hypothetical protein